MSMLIIYEHFPLPYYLMRVSVLRFCLYALELLFNVTVADGRRVLADGSLIETRGLRGNYLL